MADPALVDSIANEISGIESSGDYAARGPVTKTGDRAYGKYQIMGANIPTWTNEALGRPLTPEQFAADQDAQERTAKHRMGVYLDQYGTPEDVASMWHSGKPFAESSGLHDQLGTATVDYATRVKNGVAGSTNGGVPASAEQPTEPTEPAEQPLVVVLPDGTRVNLGVNPSPELRERVKAKIRERFPDLGGQTTPAPTHMTPEQIAAVPTPESAQPYRNVAVDDAGRAFNMEKGRDPEAWQGKYGAMIGKPIADALDDVVTAFTEVNPESTGSPLELATWKDALDRSLKILHPLGVIGEAAGNVVQQAATDGGASPEVAAALGFAASIAGGAKTPIPGLESGLLSNATRKAIGLAEKPPPGPMPFQGTATARQTAQEAERAAVGAETQAGTARAASEAAATEADRLAAEADRLAGHAETAEQVAAPSPLAKERVRTALAPEPPPVETPPAGTPGSPTNLGEVAGPGAGRSAATTARLERGLKDVKEPAQGIYESAIDNAEAAGKTMAAEHSQEVLDQIDEIKNTFGNTLGGQSKKVIDDIQATIESGNELTPRQADAYKQELDTLFKGRVGEGATPKDRAMWDFKWRFRDMMRTMFDEGDREWVEAADSVWRHQVVGKDTPTAIGQLVKLAKKNPDTFVERVFGTGASDKNAVYARAVMKHLDDAGKVDMRHAVMARAMDQAIDHTTGNLDYTKLLKHIGKFNEGFYDAVVDDSAKAFFKTLQQEQANVATTAAAAKTAARLAKTAEGGAKTAERTAAQAEKGVETLRGKAEAAKEAAKAPNRLAYMTAKGLEIAGTETLGRVFGHVPGGGLIGLIIPPHSLARMLANSGTANMLARALRTGANSPAAIVLAEKIKKATEEE